MKLDSLRPGRVARSLSVATRVGLVALLVAMVSLIVTAAVGLATGGDLADSVLRDGLVARGASRGDEVESYLTAAQRQTAALGLSPGTAAAIEAFSDAFNELDAPGAVGPAPPELTEYYRTVVAPELEAARGRPVSVAPLLPVGSAARTLQAAYSVQLDPDDPTPALIEDAGDGSRWSAVHLGLHPVYREIASRAGFEDLYLIDPAENSIVYSVEKGIDFGTSLDVGPLSGSALANVVDEVREDRVAGTVGTADFALYPAAGGAPAAFIAAPVMDGASLVGIVAVRLGAERLNEIMLGDPSPDENLSAETYLASSDGTMRSDARPFVEDPLDYLARADEEGTLTADQQRGVETFDTTVLFQPVNDDVIRTALASGAGTEETVNYLGESVFSSYRTLDIDGLDWVAFAESGTAELEEPVEDYARTLLIASALFVVALTLLAVRWSNRLAEPLRLLSARLRAVRTGGPEDAGPATMPEGSPDEFVELATDVDRMLGRLTDRQAEMDEQRRERAALLRKFLPPDLVRRAESGERDVLDQIPHATVVAIVFRGLGELVRTGSKHTARDVVDRIVDELDALAREHGLDRMNLTGDEYVAACGTTRPYLDHGPRSVEFALAALDLVADISAETGATISPSIGVDSGPLTVGLTGGARLVFDSWGPTVTTASRIARTARTGTVAVAAATRAQLPARFETTAGATDEGRADLAEVTGVAVEEAKPS